MTTAEHIFEWVANCYEIKDSQVIEHMLYQYDEAHELYDKINGQIPLKTVLDLNKEGRLQAFHLVPKGSKLDLNTLPRYTVDLSNMTFQINGQLLFPFGRSLATTLSNRRLIYYFTQVNIYPDDDGKPDFKAGAIKVMRLYKLGLQGNDEEGKSHQKIMIWNREDEGMEIVDKR